MHFLSRHHDFTKTFSSQRPDGYDHRSSSVGRCHRLSVRESMWQLRLYPGIDFRIYLGYDNVNTHLYYTPLLIFWLLHRFFSWDLCIAKLYAISLLSSSVFLPELKRILTNAFDRSLNARMSALASKVYEPNPLFSSSQSSSNSDRRPTAGMSFGLRVSFFPLPMLASWLILPRRQIPRIRMSFLYVVIFGLNVMTDKKN